MKNIAFSLCAAVFGAALAAPCQAASPWTGTWKFDQAKSKNTGNTFSYTVAPNGSMTYSNGSTISYSFACDGKSYKTMGTDMLTCKKPSALEYDFAFTGNGKSEGSSVLVVAAGGKTATETITNLHADGKTDTDKETYAKVSGSTGLAGTWKDVKSSDSTPFTFSIAGQPNGALLTIPAYKETIALTFDGVPAKVVAPTAGPNDVMIGKKTGSDEFTAVQKIGTKEVADFDFKLTGAKTLTLEIWSPGKESEKSVLLYDKQ
jgi:hypothetical protein